jgi:DNA-binding response OmpR family regulator
MNKQVKIFIVDDSDIDRQLLMQVLQKKNFDVVVFNSGVQCLEQLKNEVPQLVLLDAMMPEMHGNEVLHSIREKYTRIQLPVIMITAKSDASDIVESLCLGANDYITKPVDFDVALMRIMTHLQISNLSKEMSRLEQIAALNAMVLTYNHEINNPLAIAIGNLTACSNIKSYERENYDRVESALWRIAEIIKKIEEISINENPELSDYSTSAKIFKLFNDNKKRSSYDK